MYLKLKLTQLSYFTGNIYIYRQIDRQIDIDIDIQIYIDRYKYIYIYMYMYICIYVYIYIYIYIYICIIISLQSAFVKFLTTLKSLTKILNHLDHIIWQINCEQISDFLEDKYKTLLYLKEHGSFQKAIIFCRFSQHIQQRRSSNHRHTFVFSFTEMC